MRDTFRLPAAERLFKPSKHPGVEFCSLRYDKATGAGAVLLRMAPGSAYPAHRHTGGEEVLMLEGELIVGAERFGPGDYLWSGIDSIHAPRTESGCLLFSSFPAAVIELI